MNGQDIVHPVVLLSELLNEAGERVRLGLNSYEEEMRLISDVDACGACVFQALHVFAISVRTSVDAGVAWGRWVWPGLSEPYLLPEPDLSQSISVLREHVENAR